MFDISVDKFLKKKIKKIFVYYGGFCTFTV